MPKQREFSRTLMRKIKAAVLENKDKVYQEILETRELYDLMLKWSKGVELSDAEKVAVRSQLLDICKTIPALAIFMAPFGSLLLVILIKYLPFNILPSSFDESEAPKKFI